MQPVQPEFRRLVGAETEKDTDNLFDYQCFRREKFVLQVELGGVEPPSKQVTNTLSTCLFFDWFSSRIRTKTPKSDLIP